jgi:hypothetical protein
MNPLGRLQYGEYIFPENFTHTLHSRPWYGDDGVSVKGVECVLTVDWFIYDRTHDSEPFEKNNRSQSVERQVVVMRESLLTPRLNLIFLNTGVAGSGRQSFELGRIPPSIILGIDDDSILPSEVLGNALDQAAYVDADHGPLPQELKIEPVLGSGAAKCSWTCLFKYVPCKPCLEPFSSFFKKPIEFNYRQSFEIDYNSRTTIIYDGYYSFGPNVLCPFDSSTGEYRGSFTIERLLALGLKVPVGFELISHNQTISETENKVFFRVEFSEVNSNNPYIHPAIKIDGRHQAKSGVFNNPMQGSGYCTWLNKLDATITLRPGFLSSDAFYVFLFILMQKTRYRKDTAFDLRQLPFPTQLMAEMGNVDTKEHEGISILTSLTITEGLYDNTHTFSAEWLLTANLNQLLAQSGLFKHIANKPHDDKVPWNVDDKKIPPDPYNEDTLNEAERFIKSEEEWEHYTERVNSVYPSFEKVPGAALKTPLSYTTFTSIGGEGRRIVFNPCIDTMPELSTLGLGQDQFVSNTNRNLRLSGTTNLIKEFVDPSLQSEATIDADAQNTVVGGFLNANRHKTFVDYQVSFEVIENSRTYQIPINQGDALNQEQFLDRKTTKFEQAVNAPYELNSGTMVPFVGNDQGSVLTVGGQSTYMLIMRGYAKRAYFTISCPAVMQVEGYTTYRAPGMRFEQRRVTTGRVPMYEAEWEVPYLVTGPLHKPFSAEFPYVGALFVGMPYTNALPDDYLLTPPITPGQ